MRWMIIHLIFVALCSVLLLLAPLLSILIELNDVLLVELLATTWITLVTVLIVLLTNQAKNWFLILNPAQSILFQGLMSLALSVFLHRLLLMIQSFLFESV